MATKHLWSCLVPILAALITVSATTVPTAPAAERPTEIEWILEPPEAAKLLEEADATVLDVRSRTAWRSSHVAGAVHFDWTEFTPSSEAERGTLLDDDSALESRLRALGISNARPVVVVGPADGGWGEAGRAVWMLRTLGHDATGWVDGGHRALVAEGIEISESSPKPNPGSFEVDRREDWSIERDRLRAIYQNDDVALLDTRQPREYDGATPYGESRGGHIPGARHFHFRELIGDDGRLLPPSRIRSRLEQLGVEPTDTVVTYCTGGVRSAWVATVLVEVGYDDVRNYAGSTWEWSAGPAERFPLETD